MKRSSHIRSLHALLLLLVFTLSITPKLFLHDLVADHRDYSCALPEDGGHHFTKAGINCECNTLVATSPFTEYQPVDVIPATRLYTALPPSFVPVAFSSAHTFFELRGPPAAACQA